MRLEMVYVLEYGEESIQYKQFNEVKKVLSQINVSLQFPSNYIGLFGLQQ